MASIFWPILGKNTAPDTSGYVYRTRSHLVRTTAPWQKMVYVFANPGSSRFGVHGDFRVPDDYLSDASFLAEVATSANSGVIRLEVDYRVITIGSESLNQSGVEETINNNVAAKSSAWIPETSNFIPADDSAFLPGRHVDFSINRDQNEGDDTLNATVTLEGFYFKYTPTSEA